MKSLWSVEFGKFPGTVQELGRKFHVAPSTISRWRRGSATPSAGKLVEIHEAGGPHPTLIDQPLPGQPVARPRPEVPVAAATPEAVIREADTLLQHVRCLQDELTQTDEPLATRSRVAGELARTIDVLGKLTGVSVINERQILKSPAFSRVRGVMVDALSEWPAALESVASALESLEGSE